MTSQDKLQIINYLKKLKEKIDAEYEHYNTSEQLAELLSDYDTLCKITRLIEEYSVIISSLSRIKDFIN